MLRDSRPSGVGNELRTLSFPWPSTIAGLARTRSNSDKFGEFQLSKRAEIENLKEIQVKGPWLVEMGSDSEWVPCFPAPSDCVFHPGDNDGILERRRLKPGELLESEDCDLPDGLHPLLLEDAPQTKPARNIPSFWRWSDLEEWLLEPPDHSTVDSSSFGVSPLSREIRTHVGIDLGSSTAQDGALFSTEMLRFSDTGQRLALAFSCESGGIKPGAVHLGGERRISFLSEHCDQISIAPELSASDSVYRLILVTPAVFEQGWRPSQDGLQGAELIAASVGRPEVISGWDFLENAPKKCRRMAPAGSVYWVKLKEGINPKEWIDRMWMNSISDDKQDKLDGFGICIVGVG
jgi:CRISPR-associated protein Cmr3